MPRLDCITILEAGSFGSDSGTVLIPSGSVPFPIEAFSVGTAAGTGTATAVGYNAAGEAVGMATGIGTATGVSPGGGSEFDAMTPAGQVTLTTNNRQAMLPGMLIDEG